MKRKDDLITKKIAFIQYDIVLDKNNNLLLNVNFKCHKEILESTRKKILDLANEIGNALAEDISNDIDND